MHVIFCARIHRQCRSSDPQSTDKLLAAEPRRGERTKKKRVFFGEEAKESEEEEQDEEDEEVASASPRRARSMTLFGFPRRVRASGNCAAEGYDDAFRFVGWRVCV